jgi:methyl-accepting chemotaxis protein
VLPKHLLHPLKKLGFRGLFLLIGLSFLISFALLAVPQALDRLQSTQRAQARLDAIEEIQPLIQFVDRMRTHRRALFLKGAGDVQMQIAEIRRPPEISPGFVLPDQLQTLFALSAEETTSRRRMQYFAEYSEALLFVQGSIADHVRRASGASDGLAQLMLEDMPDLLESISQIQLLAGMAVREGGLQEKMRPALSAAIAVAGHTQAKLRNVVEQSLLEPAQQAEMLARLEKMDDHLALARTIAYGMAISNASYGLDEVDATTGQYIAAVRDFSAALQPLLEKRLRVQLLDARHDFLLTTLIILLGFLLSSSGLLISYRRLASSVDSLARGARELATGNLSAEIHLEGDDELQIIARSLREVRDGLRTLVTEIINSAHAMTTGSLSFAHAATSSAERARQQEADTQRLVEAFEETARQVSAIVEAASETDDAAKNSDELATSGMTSVGEAKRVLEDMNADINIATACLDRLEAETNRVSSVVAVIASVAEQTNLLALNAAIEAARAGESGRGFAVVADEVRKLAERTAQSTREIRETMERMQQIAGETVGAVRTAAGHVQSSNEQASEAALAMGRVRDQSRLVESSSSRISEALNTHHSENQRIEKLVCGIADLSVENGLALASAAQSALLLEGLATDLRQAIGQFRLTSSQEVSQSRSTGDIDLF